MEFQQKIHVFRGKQKKKDNSHMSFVKVLNTGTHRQTVWSKKTLLFTRSLIRFLPLITFI